MRRAARPQNSLRRNFKFEPTLLLGLALTGTALYACVLPLWEGWDEPFHYARITTIAVQHELGVLNQTTVSREVDRSLRAVPLSHLLAPTIPGGVSFEDWQRLAPAQKQQMRHELQRLSPKDRQEASTLRNYEAQQTPLVYLVLAPLEAALSGLPLLSRILLLRLLSGLSAMPLVYFGLKRLADALEIDRTFQFPLLFCALSVQMLWACLSHVGNDGFAIVAVVWFLELLAARRPLWLLGLLLGVGLLTKAYLLAFVPVLVAKVAVDYWRKRVSWQQAAGALLLPALLAGPWYLRNIRLYGSFSGTQESVAGVTASLALRAVPHVNWVDSFVKSCRESLWTGNWSFTAFSRSTMTIEELLMLAGLVLAALAWRKLSARELWLSVALLFFTAGLFYQTCVTWQATHGLAVVPEPWYAQGMVLCVWALVFRGFSLWPRAGRVLSILLCCVAAWVALATFVVKMLPGYGGGFERGTLRAVAAWWRAHPTEDLRAVMPASPTLIYPLLAAYLLLLTGGVFFSIRAVLTGPAWSRDKELLRSNS